MFELKLETVGGRLVMTGLATVVWLATVSVRYGWSPMVALIGFLILLFVIPFTPRLNKVLPSPTALLPKPPRRITTTLLEFVLYGGFIGLVTYQSVGL
ncbi:MAG TPA: hypothetical protein VK639_10095, partial [Terriglobales bacterium]|nr:hypothetical protein [Terriglobales bacterium]